jgi:hypothetical protein
MQTQQKKDGVQYSESTLFLCVDDEHEYRIAQAYLKEKYPGTPASLVRAIPVDRLQPQHVIIPLYRTRGCTPALVTETEGKAERVKHTPIKEMVGEVFEAKHVNVKDCWTVLSAAGSGIAFSSVSGQVAMNKLCNMVSALLQDPICIQPSGIRIRHLKIGQ